MIVIDDLLDQDQFKAAAAESLQANYVASGGNMHAHSGTTESHSCADFVRKWEVSPDTDQPGLLHAVYDKGTWGGFPGLRAAIGINEPDRNQAWYSSSGRHVVMWGM